MHAILFLRFINIIDKTLEKFSEIETMKKRAILIKIAAKHYFIIY